MTLCAWVRLTSGGRRIFGLADWQGQGQEGFAVGRTVVGGGQEEGSAVLVTRVGGVIDRTDSSLYCGGNKSGGVKIDGVLTEVEEDV